MVNNVRVVLSQKLKIGSGNVILLEKSMWLNGSVCEKREKAHIKVKQRY